MTFLRVKHLQFLIFGLVFMGQSCIGDQQHGSGRTNIDFDWKFYHGEVEGGESTDLDDGSWELIDLPHDWSIEGPIRRENPSGWRGGFFPGGIGWYRKELPWHETWADKQVTVTFDGVYMNSDVWLNGSHLGRRPNGYVGFSYDLTPCLEKGKNILAVRVDNSKQPSGRWYTGCGIYRHVWLDVNHTVHIPPSGTYVYFTGIDSSSATMHLETEVSNTGESDEQLIVETRLLDDEKAVVRSVSSLVTAEGNRVSRVRQTLTIDTPQLWSTDNPRLYDVETVLRKGNTLLDRHTTITGIRSTRFDPETGFWLNDSPLKLKGICMHHDAGAIGSAVPEDVLHRRLQLLKQMGCNAIRTSHNPFSPEFYAMCDSMGFLVMDEALDGWDQPKAAFDYGLHFSRWWKKDITAFVRRDRNHPSVIMWSIGNEVRGRTDSIEILLVDLVHQLDPTRPVTMGAGHDARICDIAGFNGHGEIPGRLEQFHREHADWNVVGTEIPHTWQTRGVYRTRTWWRGRNFPAPWNPVLGQEPGEGRYDPIPDLTEKEVFTGFDSSYLSSYDNATVRISARDQWKRTSRFEFLMGEFRWTGFDYLGENIWPNRGWHCGVIDLAGFPKDLYYFYQSVWTKKPMVHLLPHWTHPGKENVEIPVMVYSNCDEVELFLNNRPLGTRKNDGHQPDLLWYLPYEPGTLKAVARIDGKDVAVDQHITASIPHAIELSSDRSALPADRRSVAHIRVEITDKQGHFVPDANVPFTCEIKGPARLLGVENGDMLDLTVGTAPVKKTFHGLCLILIQHTGGPGTIGVTVRPEGMKQGMITMEAIQPER